MSITSQDFGSTQAGETVTQFCCANRDGYRLMLIDYGAHLVAFEFPDHGRTANVTLGFSKLDGYLERHPYFGSTVGRYCNRIADGRFQLNGQSYPLATNNGRNHLHGGDRGFDAHMWQADSIQTTTESGVRFHRVSPAGEEGFPGELAVTATYLLTDKNELRIEFEATTSSTTVVNLTNHTYWNLAGPASGSILDHRLTIAADHYLSVNEALIPTGQLAPVEGTPLDFRTPVTVGARIRELDGDPGGYDHCYVLGPDLGELRWAARVEEPTTGRVMEVLTTQPGIQFYSGNFLNGSRLSGGFPKHAGLCLETQHFPDSPNQPSFPSTVLRPGETFRQRTIHKFSTGQS